ncbi:hypothetical protein ES754_09640 [Psychrobacter frigidicola]|uniref:Uncharacterized protein n=1 Tax=Psychrobacter frigidicola TaxID=45611 RepID=A0A5C7A0N8_9GAMM|nr:hypothetical protein [Psychrobacter frigidicola]TXD96402.1 hypothetical protein ES754_09640 [Psychrobacter frigidicola]
MNQIRKHTFEAVSLLTAENGMLDVTLIPAVNQPDWIIPSGLILSVDSYDERIWTYLWQQQEVAVFHLLPRNQTPDKLIVLEGNTAVHRLALQTTGELRHLKVRISDVKDAELPERYVSVARSNSEDNMVKDDGFDLYQQNTSDEVGAENIKQNMAEEHFRENVIISYLFQTITIDDIPYLVPDLDKIAHQLVDLDS